MQPYDIISWDDAIECALSCAEDLGPDEDQAAAANLELGVLFDKLPPELKIEIWKEALLDGEKSVQYELLFRLPYNGGATARAITSSPGCHGHQPYTRQRGQRIWAFASLSREALVAVRDIYVWLPQHTYLGGRGSIIYGGTVAPRQLDSRVGSWACPAIDRFSWAMVTTTMKTTATTTWHDVFRHQYHHVINDNSNTNNTNRNSNSNSESNGKNNTCPWQLLPQPSRPPAACKECYRHPPMSEFLACCLQMPDTPSHPMYPWPGSRDLYAKFCMESIRLLGAVHHLDLMLPALLGQLSWQAAAPDVMEAFPHLRSVAITVSNLPLLPLSPVPRAVAATVPGPTILGSLDRANWRRYVEQNDPWVKVSLGHVLSWRYAGMGEEIPKAWGCLADVPPCAGFSLIYSHVVISVLKAGSVYGVGQRGWQRFLEFYRLLTARGVDVFIISGHSTQSLKPLSY
ncbi:hypothetical protein SLS62_007695 [Diatrype stigma]|uniref:Uncharacterized protein n=1 Tax=Diatrype stigma TaxID=117547 RepID=A0AAN9YN86_9PEZI